MSELEILREYLEANDIEYEWIDLDRECDKEGFITQLERHQIIVFEDGKRIWDAVCHYGSYGYEEGLLEVYGKPVVMPEDGDSVCGWLTAEDVISRWEEYKSNGGHW